MLLWLCCAYVLLLCILCGLVLAAEDEGEEALLEEDVHVDHAQDLEEEDEDAYIIDNRV